MKLGVFAVTLVALSFATTASVSAPRSTTASPGSLGWSSCNLRECKNRCADTYPSGGGPLITCRRLCDENACNVVFNQRGQGRPAVEMRRPAEANR